MLPDAADVEARARSYVIDSDSEASVALRLRPADATADGKLECGAAVDAGGFVKLRIDVGRSGIALELVAGTIERLSSAVDAVIAAAAERPVLGRCGPDDGLDAKRGAAE